MRCDLANALRQAAEAIDPDRDDYAYAYLLGEVAQHIRDVRDGKHTLDEFADFYMIRPSADRAEAA